MSLLENIVFTKSVYKDYFGLDVETVVVPDKDYREYASRDSVTLFSQGVVVRSQSQHISDKLNGEQLGFTVYVLDKNDCERLY